MSKTCLHKSLAIILTLFVANLNANPKPKADNRIDIIINRVGPMVGPRMLSLRKPGISAGHWAMMPQNPGPEPKEVERPTEDYPGYRSGYLNVQPNIAWKCCPPKLIVSLKTPVTKPNTKLAAKPKKTYRSAVLPVAKPATKPAAKPAAKPKKLMKGARWIPRAPIPEYEINVEQYNPGAGSSRNDDYYPYDY